MTEPVVYCISTVAATILNQDIAYLYLNHNNVQIYAYQSCRHGGSPSVPVPVVLKQLNNAIKSLR